jgi:aminodeoxyfutalosine deaminase
VEYLGVERIGHGVTAVRDPALIKHLKERNITIESCPTSNVRTGVIPSLCHHPIRNLFDYGVNLTANSDDPTMFNTDMNNEYLQLHEVLGFNVPELFRLSLNAVNSSFLHQEQKDRMQDTFVKEYQRIVERAESSKQRER